ncbi:MAG: YARHG domain-containing protein [Myxococcaceae bacterium]
MTRTALAASLVFSVVAFAAPPPAPAAPPVLKERPLYLERAITPEDLKGRSLRELTLMRNWIYALRGNEFRRRWLADFFAAQPWYQPNQRDFLSGEWQVNRDFGEGVVKRDDANAERIATFESELTREDLLARRDEVRARVKGVAVIPPLDLIELKLLSIRLGGWAGEGTPPPLSPLEDPARLDKVLTLESLDDLSPRDLKILRNTIFARRGRAFETPLVKGHFKTVEWYQVDPKYTDARLTDVDKKNVKLIQSLERQLKRENETNYMVAA